MRGHKEKPEAWRAPPLSFQSFRNFPFLITLALIGTLGGIASSFVILQKAHDSPVDSWVVSPTVLLSIVATVSRSLMGFAFHEAVELYWWSKLLSEQGTRIQELHTVWDLGSSLFALFHKSHGDRWHRLMRFTAISVILMGVNGPLLQRAVGVEIETRSEVHFNKALPIRQEPIWNLTTRPMGSSGWVWSAPPFQDEFAQVVSDLNQRVPMRLSGPACTAESTCKTNVTVAGFVRKCTQNTASFRGIPSTSAAMLVRTGDQSQPCLHTSFQYDGINLGANGSSVNCAFFETLSQLSFEAWTPPESPLPNDTTSGDLPWKRPDLPPTILSYISYTRRDIDSETITIEDCHFSTAFVNLPIIIKNGSVVTIDRSNESKSRRQGVESIPAPITSIKDSAFSKGIIQAMKDQYEGYIFVDHNEHSNLILGSGLRQYVNQSSIRKIAGGRDNGFTFSVLEPLQDFSATLDEISLRYALTKIPHNEARSNEMLEYLNNTLSIGSDNRAKALPLMKMQFSKTSTVKIEEDKPTPVYKANFIYTGVAMGVTTLASVLVTLLLQGWSLLGRKMTLSPLEVAKAFDAPLLSKLSSNSTAENIANGPLCNLKVRYGEVYPASSTETESESLLAADHLNAGLRPNGSGTDISNGEETEAMKNATVNDSETDQVEGLRRRAGGPRLMVESAGLVNRPVNGIFYN